MRRIALASLTLVLALPAAAPAQQANDDGVIIDDESPTSKEYAVPTEEARRDASGGANGPSGSSGGSGGGEEAPLFGVGVDSRDGSRDRGGRAGGEPGGANGRAKGAGDTAGETATSNDRAAATGGDSDSADAGLSPSTLGLGIAAVVVLLAAGIAYFLKRRDGWPSPTGNRG